MGRRGKPSCRVIREKPLLVGIVKNGRGVTEAAARAALAKAFLEVPVNDWRILRSDHGNLAVLINEEA